MSKRKKNFSRYLALVTAAALTCALWVPALAASTPGTPKEEVVYINLNPDGSVREINVVNSFDLDGDGLIVDYGDYKSVRNMNTTDKIEYADGTVHINANAGKLYYEGRLDSTIIPWDISIHYYMDGQEYPAEEIAGQSGALRIAISITENTDSTGSFFEGHALQASITLDTGRCRNISAPDATIANVGSDKQLTYTILPDTGADIEITADVTEFEMDGVSINALPLNLSLEVDDGELMAQIIELMDAVEKLDDGAGELADGAAELQSRAQSALSDGVSDLQEGADRLYQGAAGLKDGGERIQNGIAGLHSGAAALDEGIQSLDAGLTQMQGAMEKLNGQSGTLADGSTQFKAALVQLQAALSGVSVTSKDLSALASASAAIKAGIADLVTGTDALYQSVSPDAYRASMLQHGLDIDALKKNNEAAIGNLRGLITGLKGQVEALKAAGTDVSALETQIGQLQTIITLLDANNASIAGTENYLTTVHQNLSALLDGAKALQTNYAAFDAKIVELVNSLGSLAYQMSELSAAVNTLVAEYEKLDGGIAAYTGAVAQVAAGYLQAVDGISQLSVGSAELVSGSQSLYNGTDELLLGIGELYNGVGALRNGMGALDDGTVELLSGITQLYEGSRELKDGTSELREETADMDTQINDKIDELLKGVTGGDVESESFVSSRNSEIKGVQFVIKTDGIAVKEAASPTVTEPETLNFWQKFLMLFGLY